MMKMIPI